MHALVEASRVLITRNNNDLEGFLAANIPIVVAVFQVRLDISATFSPRCGVKDHDEFEAGNAGLA